MVRYSVSDTAPEVLVRQLAEMFANGRPTRVKAGHVRVDHRRVDDLVRHINRATGTPVRRDWRGRVKASPSDPLAVSANAARDVVQHARQLPLTDDVVLPGGRAAEVAASLRRALA